MAPTTSFREAARAVLAPPAMAMLETAGEVARGGEWRLYLVGGAVRDVLLGRPTEDLDLMTVGGGSGLAEELAAALEGSVVSSSPFSTWHLEAAGGRRLDLASARSESYASAAALPTTRPGTLEEDLARRDFSINAMAVELGGVWSEPIDPLGGRADLDERRLAVLHARSFEEDPTRILRGIELAERLGFEWAESTLEAARRALARGTLDHLSPSRFRTAWRRCFGRLMIRGPGAAVEGLRMAEELGLLAALSPGLGLDSDTQRSVEKLASAEAPADTRAELLLRLLASDDVATAQTLAGRWSREPALGRQWQSFAAALPDLASRLAGAEPPRLSIAVAAIDELGPQAVDLLALAPDGRFDSLLARLKQALPTSRIGLSGRHLVAEGYAPGPALGRALAATQAARLDGDIEAAEELEYARRQLESESE